MANKLNRMQPGKHAGPNCRHPDEIQLLPFVYDDGGRAATDFKGVARDCACRAVAIAEDLFYVDVYNALNQFSTTERPSKHRPKRSAARTGVYMPTMKRFMADLGWVWVPTMQIGSGCTVHLRADELPSGTLIVRLSKHFTTVVNGVIRDTYDPSRNGTRCVYGYFFNPELQQEESNRA